MLRAMIVDDEQLAVERIMMLLAEVNWIEVVHTSQDPREAYEYAKTNQIELAFLDIAMPEVNGLRLSHLLLQLHPDLNIVFVTGYDHYAVQAFEMSALDYLLKPVTVERMSNTLDKVRKKHRREESEPSGGNRDIRVASLADPQVEMLTSREAEMLHALADGLSNREIAVHFGITEATVKSHVFRIYGKLGVKRRSQAIAQSRKLKLLE